MKFKKIELKSTEKWISVSAGQTGTFTLSAELFDALKMKESDRISFFEDDGKKIFFSVGPDEDIKLSKSRVFKSPAMLEQILAALKLPAVKTGRMAVGIEIDDDGKKYFPLGVLKLEKQGAWESCQSIIAYIQETGKPKLCRR
jgi:hypothetical protein